MNSVALFGTRVVHKLSCFLFISRKLCDCSFDGGDKNDNGFQYVEEPLKRIRDYFESTRIDAYRVLDILRRDGPGFDAKRALSELKIRVSWLLVREVLTGFLRNINEENKTRCAKLGFSCKTRYLQCEEFRAMWRLADEMIEKGFHTTAQTFNILICTCGKAGLAMNVLDRFIKSKTFNFRLYKSSYNAILHSLLYMLDEHHSPDVLTSNVIFYAKLRLGKAPEFHRLLDEIIGYGIFPDFHTYNILLHEAGIDPTILHYTTLIDGLSWAGNLLGWQYFFDEMIKTGCMPDVVCYTVMITGYIMAGELEKAQEMFEDMMVNGQSPIGCNPDFHVYRTLVRNLWNAGKLSEAHEVIKQMIEKGKYSHLVAKIKGYKGC
ncbi:hypothetical protein POPTR_012G141400v4 [Populus trichocarpa]|uniref:Pentacotripeptide-repeat region of PRORP domain-containing protein n=1 Tax=Populus trichocarpa TaxID=3694 RepID=A0A2K1YDF4_POPTR|nr:hypothetical protein POPTR_012G141400v4 [Populus trichocarpa]